MTIQQKIQSNTLNLIIRKPAKTYIIGVDEQTYVKETKKNRL